MIVEPKYSIKANPLVGPFWTTSLFHGVTCTVLLESYGVNP